MKSKLLSFFTIFLFVLSGSLYGQQDYWVKSSEDKTKDLEKVNRASFPKDYQIFYLNVEKLKLAIQNAPLRGENSGKSNVIAYFPTTNGTLERFAVSNSPIMEAELAAKYPMIKTYKAVGVDDPTATMRFSITQFGLHTMSLSGKRGSLFVDPYTTEGDFHIVYDRSSLGQDLQGFECLTDQDLDLKSLTNSTSSQRADTDDMFLRTYRLAQTCSGEYGALFAGAGTDAQKKANIQAQMAITINRVNEVYERDLAITLIFIAQNDQLIYYDAATDPWTGEYNAKTQEVITTTLNDESLYDIGHNFNTSGGGNAGCLGCVCIDGAAPYTGNMKGRGHTGRANPTGDAFDIDYVAHEMGHQFDGWHSMNTCSRSGNGMTEVEPASGSSVMGYAGICATNVQSNSDAHFNYVNIRDISANIQPGGTSDCGAQMALTNQPPVANAGSDYSIPISTAFVLKGAATDPDGTGSLTYNWSPNDPSQAPTNGAPQTNWTTGPMYRSILPTDSPDRYMPTLSDVVAGNLTPTWEVTPAVARTMNFSFIVRDNGSGFANGIGQTDADLMVVNVVGTQAFTVTSQTTNETWDAGSNQPVTWNVAGTDGGAVNTPTVNILLSTDGGLTFPFTIASGVPNDGSHDVTVPTGAVTSTARIIVEGNNNIFYAVNTTNFTIQESEFVISSSNPELDVCQPTDAVYNFTYNTFLGFSAQTDFTVSGLPAGASAVVNPTSATADGTTGTVTVSGIGSLALGSYSFSFDGTSGAISKSIPLTLNVYSSTLTPTTLVSPADVAIDVPGDGMLTWNTDANAQDYFVEVASDAGFTTIVESATVQTNSYTTALAANTEYFWRVTASNLCSTASASSVFSFTTANISCGSYSATDLPVNISENGAGNSYTSVINVSANYLIIDVNVTIDITHTWGADLDVTLTSPNGTVVELTSDNGGSGDDYTATVFDQEATGGSITAGASPFTGTFVPEGDLSTIYGEMSGGDWTLTVVDDANQDGGVFNSFDLELCVQGSLSVDEFDASISNFTVYPNPNNGSFNVKLNTASNQDISIVVFDIRGRKVFNKIYKSSPTFNETINLDNVQSGMYMLQVGDGVNTQTKKMIVN